MQFVHMFLFKAFYNKFYEINFLVVALHRSVCLYNDYICDVVLESEGSSLKYWLYSSLRSCAPILGGEGTYKFVLCCCSYICIFVKS